MAYQLNDVEKQEVRNAIALCTADTNTASASGNWVPFYSTLSNIFSRHISTGDVSGQDLQNIKDVKLWLDVAIGANGRTGVHSDFIRTYTNRQAMLRLDRPFTEAEMQHSSNGVAFNLWKSLSEGQTAGDCQ